MACDALSNRRSHGTLAEPSCRTPEHIPSSCPKSRYKVKSNSSSRLTRADRPSELRRSYVAVLWRIHPQPLSLKYGSARIEELGQMLIRTTIPRDTSPEVWDMQVTALDRLGPEGRVGVALELSEFVRSVHAAGIRSRHPEWSDEEVTLHVVSTQYGVELPRPR